MTDRVIEEMMDSFRQSEQHWSRLMYLVEQVGNHSTNAKKPDIGTINEPHLSLDEISDKMLDEIREMKQRQDCAMEYLQQLYATNLQCLMKITALKEENEQLKVSQRQTVQVRVSGVLISDSPCLTCGLWLTETSSPCF
jgi:NurA-like 5'-3' nuclease